MVKSHSDSPKEHSRRVTLVLLMGVGSIVAPLILLFLYSSILEYPLAISIELDYHIGWGAMLFVLLGALLGLAALIVGVRFRSFLSNDTRQRRLLMIGKYGGVFGLAWNFLFLLSVFSMLSSANQRQAMMYDMNNIAAQAYQYRTRPISARGGGGSYQGFKLSPKMQKNFNGGYAVEMISRNSLKLRATSLEDTRNSILVSVDSSGELHGWKFFGSFNE